MTREEYIELLIHNYSMNDTIYHEYCKRFEPIERGVFDTFFNEYKFQNNMYGSEREFRQRMNNYFNINFLTQNKITTIL